jgi:hypothetical protein
MKTDWSVISPVILLFFCGQIDKVDPPSKFYQNPPTSLPRNKDLATYIINNIYYTFSRTFSIVHTTYQHNTRQSEVNLSYYNNTTIIVDPASELNVAVISW